MDDLTMLRELGGDPPPPAPEVRDAARTRLARAIEADAAPYRRRLRRFGSVAVAGVGVCAVVALVGVFALVAGTGEEPGGHAARDGARDTPPAAAPAGESEQADQEAPPRSADEPRPADDQYLYSREVIKETPADGTGPVRTFVDESWRSVDGSRPSRISERGRTWTAPPLGENTSYWPPQRYEDLAKLPTDPDKLRSALTRGGGSGGSPAVWHETEYMYLLFLLRRTTPMPPGLRDAAFRAITQIRGVKVVDDEVDARGRRGIGISRPDDRLKMVLILDGETHEYLGLRETLVDADGERYDQRIAVTDHGVVDEIGDRP